MAAPAKPALKPDYGTVLGLAVAALGIVGGLLLEGGNISDVAQLTAGLIVAGGTLGAVMVNTPLDTLAGGARQLLGVFTDKPRTGRAVIDEIIEYASKARRQGLVSLEAEAARATDPFLKKALTLAVDGCDLGELRKMMELEISAHEERGGAEAKCFEAAGGYAPTIGIIGAVMGLIQVMKNLEDIKEVGHGIAVAFVATIYGVALANLFLLPAANKIKAKVHQEAMLREMALEGIIGIAEGLNPKLIRSKLESYLPAEEPAKGKAAAGAAALRRA
ncbi:MAG: flagellar motor protein [Acidobacteria bacterium]|nr:flagellar motor protein [Acidobacteriota bacterium]